MNRLILASASPRRAELLRMAGIDFEPHPVSIDESPRPEENGVELVMRLAKGKAEACLQKHPEAVVLAADTVVLCRGEPRGKPSPHFSPRIKRHWLYGFPSGRLRRVGRGVGRGRWQAGFKAGKTDFRPSGRSGPPTGIGEDGLDSWGVGFNSAAGPAAGAPAPAGTVSHTGSTRNRTAAPGAR